MRIALHNPYDNPNYAEVESAKRFIKAARNIGHEARMVHRAFQIRAMEPDFVICMSYQVPKMTRYPTYGILTAPSGYFEQTPRFINNILSYDGYLTLSTQVRDWINDYLFATGKHRFLAEFAFTCHGTAFQKPGLDNPQLAYFGTNWDGNRHGALFRKLARHDYMQCYGPPDKWRHIDAKARRGIIPFDGVSSLAVYNRAGVGLCLHLDAFRKEDTPSNRIFEISASSAVLISDRVPIVEKIFNDTVLYVDGDLSPVQVLNQIEGHMAWIKSNPGQAETMAEKANQRFNDHFSLEKLIPRIIDMHTEVVRRKAYFSIPAELQRSNPPKVSIIVRTGGRPICYLQRCLDSIAAQTWPNIEAVVVNYREIAGLDDLFRRYADRFGVIHRKALGGHAGTTLWTGLNALKGEYFGILDDDDTIHPNHIAGLMDWMDRSPEHVGLVYSGVMDILELPLEATEPDGNSSPLLWPLEKNDIYQIDYQDDTRPVHFYPFDPQKFVQGTNYIAPNAFLAKSSLLDAQILEDPNAPRGEDYLLVLLLFAKCEFAFTWEITTEHRERAIPGDNSQYWHPKVIAIARSKIRRRLFGRYYLGQDLAFQPSFRHSNNGQSSQGDVKWTWEAVRRQLFDKGGPVPFNRRVIRIFKDLFFKE